RVASLRSRGERLPLRRRLPLRGSLKVTLAQDIQVMPFVADDHIGQSANADRIIIRHAAAIPRLLRQSAEESDRRLPSRRKLGDQIVPWPPIEFAGRSIALLVVTRQLTRLAAGDRQRPISEDSLGVGHMSYQLLHAPLVRRVAVR